MFEKVNTPGELFHYKLGAALKMENKVLEMLGDLEEAAPRPQLKQQFSHHADETRQQIDNLEQAFRAIGEEPDDSPCPAIEGLENEGKASIKKADDAVIDAVILSGAADTEHHEIAVYEGLITEADAMGNQGVVRLLQENLGQEQHTLRRQSARAPSSPSSSSPTPFDESEACRPGDVRHRGGMGTDQAGSAQ